MKELSAERKIEGVFTPYFEETSNFVSTDATTGMNMQFFAVLYVYI